MGSDTKRFDAAVMRRDIGERVGRARERQIMESQAQIRLRVREKRSKLASARPAWKIAMNVVVEMKETAHDDAMHENEH